MINERVLFMKIRARVAIVISIMLVVSVFGTFLGIETFGENLSPEQEEKLIEQEEQTQKLELEEETKDDALTEVVVPEEKNNTKVEKEQKSLLKASKKVAQIYIVDDDDNIVPKNHIVYSSLKEAVEELQEGEYIYLLSDVDAGLDLSKLDLNTDYVRICLNGFTLTSSSSYTLTIPSGVSLYLTGGSIEKKVKISKNGRLDLDEVSMTSNSSQILNDGYLSLTDVTLADKKDVIINQNTGEVYFLSGKYSFSKGMALKNKGLLNISGGDYHISGDAVLVDTEGTVEIYAGAFRLDRSENLILDLENKEGALAVYGGIYSIEISDDFIARGYGFEERNNVYEVVKQSVAAIGEEEYTSFDMALEEAKDGDTIKLLGNASDFKFDQDKNLTIDMNGFCLCGEEEYPLEVSAGSLTLKNGTVESDSYGILLSNGKLVTQDVVISTPENGGVGVFVEDKASYTMNAGQITGNYGIQIFNCVNQSNVTIKSGVIKGKTYGIRIHGEKKSKVNTKLKIEGGSISGGQVAIMGNTGNDGSFIDITGGNITGKYFTIYHPQKGTLNISGGVFTGNSVIYANHGDVSIEGGNFKAIGKKTNITIYQSEENPNEVCITGDIFILDSNSKSNCNVEIFAGTFESKHAGIFSAKSLASIKACGGFYSAKLKDSYLEKGYQMEPVKNLNNWWFIQKEKKISNSDDYILSRNVLVYALVSGKKDVLEWENIPDADGYHIYGADCGSKYKKIKTIKGNKTKKVMIYSLSENKNHKYYMVAYKLVNGKKVDLCKSKNIHITRQQGFTNPSAIAVDQESIYLKENETKKLYAQVIKKSGKKLLGHTKKIRYATEDSSIARVSTSGTVKAKKTGTTRIFILGENGVYTKVKVVVR